MGINQVEYVLTSTVTGHGKHAYGWHIASHLWFPHASLRPHTSLHGGQSPVQHFFLHWCLLQSLSFEQRFSHWNSW